MSRNIDREREMKF